MKFTNKYVLVPIERYNSLKHLHDPKSSVLNSKSVTAGEDVDDTSPSIISNTVKTATNKSNRKKNLPKAPTKPPPGIQDTKRILKVSPTPRKRNKSKLNIKWRAI